MCCRRIPPGFEVLDPRTGIYYNGFNQEDVNKIHHFINAGENRNIKILKDVDAYLVAEYCSVIVLRAWKKRNEYGTVLGEAEALLKRYEHEAFQIRQRIARAKSPEKPVTNSFLSWYPYGNEDAAVLFRNYRTTATPNMVAEKFHGACDATDRYSSQDWDADKLELARIVEELKKRLGIE